MCHYLAVETICSGVGVHTCAILWPWTTKTASSRDRHNTVRLVRAGACAQADGIARAPTPLCNLYLSHDYVPQLCWTASVRRGHGTTGGAAPVQQRRVLLAAQAALHPGRLRHTQPAGGGQLGSARLDGLLRSCSAWVDTLGLRPLPARWRSTRTTRTSTGSTRWSTSTRRRPRNA